MDPDNNFRLFQGIFAKVTKKFEEFNKFSSQQGNQKSKAIKLHEARQLRLERKQTSVIYLGPVFESTRASAERGVCDRRKGMGKGKEWNGIIQGRNEAVLLGKKANEEEEEEEKQINIFFRGG